MARVKLTAGRVRDFELTGEQNQGFLWDSDAPGLAVRATIGAKAYIFQGRLNGKVFRVTIGDARVWGIDEARQEARRLQTAVDQGVDPRQQKADRIAEAEAQRIAEAQRETTVGEAWAEYVAARSPKWSEATQRDHDAMMKPGGEPRPKRGRRPGDSDKTLPGMLYPLAGTRLTDIDADMLQALMEANNARGKTQAALAFRMLRAFLNWCDQHKTYKNLIDLSAHKARAVRDQVQRSQAKDDCLQREMLRPWFEQVRQLSSATTAAYLQMVLLTGARSNELTGLRWDDVDFRWATLRIGDKVSDARTIPLTPYVAGLLRELKRINDTPPPEYRILHGKRIKNDLERWEPSPWVFSSAKSASGHAEDLSDAHERAAKAAGLPDITLHGLRRSFGTLAEWVECPSGVSAQIMGHAPSALAEKHYRVRPIDLLRLWHTRIEAWILAEAGIEQPNQEQAAPALRAVS